MNAPTDERLAALAAAHEYLAASPKVLAPSDAAMLAEGDREKAAIYRELLQARDALRQSDAMRAKAAAFDRLAGGQLAEGLRSWLVGPERMKNGGEKAIEIIARAMEG